MFGLYTDVRCSSISTPVTYCQPTADLDPHPAPQVTAAGGGEGKVCDGNDEGPVARFQA